MAILPGGPVYAKTAPEPPSNADTLVEVYNLLVQSHYSRPDADRILQGAIQGMLDVVGDPYSSYMTPAEYADFMNAIQQRYAGIGVTLDASEGRLLITEVFPQGPAFPAGILGGDEIMAVDGVPVEPGTVSSFPEKIRGAAGTPVTLLIKRGNLEITLTLTRAEIQLPLTSQSDLGNGVSYLRVLSFGATTAQESIAAIEAAEKQGAKGLVIDLRGNGGGSVLAALQMADALLEKGTLLIVHDEQGNPEAFTADAQASTLPVVVLIDGYSASASEILAGALQKNGRARLVGSQSFGKGTMQSPFELPNGGVLKLSVDRWELADGTSPDSVGLTPDVPIQTPELVIHAATALLNPSQATMTYSLTAGSVTVGGQAVAGAPRVVEREGKLYLPLRFTLEAMGQAVGWDQATSAVTFTMAGQPLQLDLQGGTLRSAGREMGQPGDLFVADGRTYLSVSLLDSLTGIAAAATEAEVTVRLGDQ